MTALADLLDTADVPDRLCPGAAASGDERPYRCAAGSWSAQVVNTGPFEVKHEKHRRAGGGVP
jgi:hypothetical protein